MCGEQRGGVVEERMVGGGKRAELEGGGADRRVASMERGGGLGGARTLNR